MQREQDSEFKRRLAEEYENLWPVAINLCRNREDARDLVQQTMLRALNFEAHYQEQGFFRAWLFRIMRNEYFTEKRRVKRSHHFRTLALPLLQEGVDHHSELSLAEIDELVARLSPEQRVTVTPILLGASYNETAEATGTTVGTVKSRLWRARAKMKEMINA